MYVLNCDIILAWDGRVVDRRGGCKAGKKKHRCLRLGMPCCVDDKLAEEGTDVP